MNGIPINEDEFMALPVKKQMAVLYQNQVKTISLLEGYKFNQKVSYVIMSIITGAILILCNMHLKL